MGAESKEEPEITAWKGLLESCFQVVFISTP